ncbi:MAG TPA: TolC family protein [Bacteroidales bacterium]|nr:TolC family protein [Bacteroidales bacterium]
MKKRGLVLIIVLIPWLSCIEGQKILTLKECYDMASKASALSGEKNAYSDIWQLKDKNLAKGWLPSLDAGGNFIYNSSVVDMTSVLGSLPIPGIANLISPLPHEQYKITVDINQVIYDGGAIKSAREIEKAGMNVSEKETETDLYKLRSLVNGYYFNLLLIDRQKEILNNYLSLVNKRIKTMESALANGVIIKSDIDIMSSEKIKIDQQIRENEIMKASLLAQISDLTGTRIDEGSQFILPSLSGEISDELLRPELQLFDLRKEQLAAGLKAVDSKRMPKAFGFATLGYGNPPGNNFFKDAFEPYYIIGAGIKWNIFDWNKGKNEKDVITKQQQMLDNRKADLTDNLKRLLQAKKAEIENLNSLVESDSSLIAVRKRITASSESQYNNSTITATEYLSELNAEQQAVINYEIHKIKLSMAKVEYMNISGKEIE